MESSFLQVVERLEKMDVEDRALRASGKQENPEDGLWALHPDTARLLHILVQTAGAKRMMEVGVSHGYSTLWLAHAARITGGRLTALEISARSIETASANLEEAGLLDVVDFVPGDARETLRDLEGQFDYILLDCWDRLYPEIIPHVIPAAPGGRSDDHGQRRHRTTRDSRHFRSLLMAYDEIETKNVPIGLGGLEVSTKRTQGHTNSF